MGQAPPPEPEGSRFERPAELYLGTHMTNWLWEHDLEALLRGVTLFVSRVRLSKRVSRFPRARHPYCIDSGGFTELQRHGRWTLTPAQYIEEVRRYLSELGADLCRWVAPQDWMCEELVIYGGAGRRGVLFHGTQEARGVGSSSLDQDLTAAVRIHQRLTVDNVLELRSLAPGIPFICVLQGSRLEDYVHCERLYAEAGIDLTAEPVVGIGSVCRRQGTTEIAEIARHFAAKGIRLHGFGVKTLGLASYADALVSADSMAWSEDGRYSAALPGHTHRSCANCPDWAIRWHRRIVQQHLSPAV
ncbi:deazapurine DNA modification protein DpdA family protein [Streptomyces sp. NBC_01422]|uniref:deazapurine DNA modification protein DpdA family protein n=1 Tax=Streptomyces sp. NBC_01422 TaxID=2903859 RepID=UPI003FCE09B7